MTGVPPTADVRAVAVDGGELAVEVSAGNTAPVLAIHGVSSTRRLWDWVRAADPGLTLVMPDLRGRAASVDVRGGSSVRQHTEDLIRVLDVLGLESVPVCGMSMGGFVAVELAARYPDRVRSLVLIDGGYPFAVPAGLSREVLPAMFADRLARLEQRWDSVADYRDFFVANTAPLLNPDDPLLMPYLQHDLRNGLVQLSGAALLSDAADIYFGVNSWDAVTAPIRFLHAQWSVGADSPAGYRADQITAIGQKAVEVVYLAGHDHAGTVMTDTGGAATARLIRAALAFPAAAPISSRGPSASPST